METYKKRSDMGFFVPEVRREYLPIKLFVRFEKEVIGYNPFDDPEDIVFKPSYEYTEMLCMAGRNMEGEQSFFVKRAEDVYAREVLNLHNIRLLFDADIFFNLMFQTSKKNKMMFFRLAELPNKWEMDRFLNMVQKASMTERDRHRATTWILQIASRQHIL